MSQANQAAAATLIRWDQRLAAQQLTLAYVEADGLLTPVRRPNALIADGTRIDDSAYLTVGVRRPASAPRLAVVGQAQLWAFTRRDVLCATAELLAQALADDDEAHRTQAEAQQLSMMLSETYEELSLIYQISGGMRVNRRPEDFFRQACFDVAGVIGAGGVGVAVCSDSLVSFPPSIHGTMSLRPAEVQQLTEQIRQTFEKRDRPLLLNTLQGTPFDWLSGKVRNLLAVGMHRHEKRVGLLFALDRAEEFDSQDIKLLSSIGNEAAIYLENTSLYEDVHDLMMGLLHSLVRAVDAKDAYTCGHSERVAMISRTLASAIGLSEHQVERVYMAGLLHDVGKIGVPEEVLRKAGKLTDEEFEAIKRHPEIGAKILRDVRQIQDIIPGVLHHHERYDGRGYPRGLAGADIPLMGRIICLADCFDAMTSNRTYRKALPVEAAMAEIKRCSGVQFDPRLTDAFIGIGVETLLKLTQISQEKGLNEPQSLLRAG